MIFTISLGNSRKQLQVKAYGVSIDDISLMVAQYYGDEWYGSNISDEDGNFICHAVREYYNDIDPTKSVYEWAISSHISSIRRVCGLCEVGEDYEGTDYKTNYNPFVEIGK